MTTAYITVTPGVHYRLRSAGVVYKNVSPHNILVPAIDYEKCDDPSIAACSINRGTRPWGARFLSMSESMWDIPAAWRTPTETGEVIPPFVAPEPPADPVEPAPAPDSPEVAVLRSLLGDRQHVRHTYDSDLAAEQEEISDLEEQLVEAKVRAAHLETCIAAVDTEISNTKAAIVKLGGTVGEDVG